MKHIQKKIILHRIYKLVLCGGFILTLNACGLKGDLYMPSDPSTTATQPSSDNTPPNTQQQNQED